MEPVSGPRVDQINVVVGDVAAAARFLVGLGVDLPSTMPEWETHHRSIPAATSLRGGHDVVEPTFGIDLDSGVFAQRWGGLAPSFAGVVLNLRVHERAEVDRLHDLALSLAAQSLEMPYDAFWGSRYAVVEGPGPLIVGFMSVPDPSTAAPRPIQPRSADPASPSGGSYSATTSIGLSRLFLLEWRTSPKCRAGAALSAAPNSAGDESLQRKDRRMTECLRPGVRGRPGRVSAGRDGGAADGMRSGACTSVRMQV